MSLLNLSHPDLRSIFLRNNYKEKVEYLQIPMNLTVDKLKQDIENGAKQFSELPLLIQKDKNEKYVFITASSEELAHMAVTYLTGAYYTSGHPVDREDSDSMSDDDIKNPFDSDSDDDEFLDDVFDELDETVDIIDGNEFMSIDDADDNDELEAGYEESEDRVPIIKSSEVLSVLRRNNQEVGFDAFAGLRVAGTANVKPFWSEKLRGSVCIVMDDVEDPDTMNDVLNYFSTCERIYAVFCSHNLDFLLNSSAEENEESNEDAWGGGFGFNPWDPADTYQTFRGLILDFAGDSALVRFKDTDERKKYYTAAFNTIQEHMHIEFEDEAMKNRIIDRIINLKKRRGVLDQFRKILRYAIKDKKENSEKFIVDINDIRAVNNILCLNIIDDKYSRSRLSVMERLDKELIGMAEVKRQFRAIISGLFYQRMLAKRIPNAPKTHNALMFLGAPGTAKTTIAQMLGDAMKEYELLPDNRFISVSGPELKGKYVGHTAPKVRQIVETHDIIFVDEAYALVGSNDDGDSFGREALAQLAIEMEKHGEDKLFIFAGYGGKKVTEKNNMMKSFLDANPGIRSRIGSTMFFDSYDADELVKIFKNMAECNKYIMPDRIGPVLRKYFEKRCKDVNFGNGREARVLLDACIRSIANRMVNFKSGLFDAEKFNADLKARSVEDLMTFTQSDIKAAIADLEQASLDTVVKKEKKAVGF